MNDFMMYAFLVSALTLCVLIGGGCEEQLKVCKKVNLDAEPSQKYESESVIKAKSNEQLCRAETLNEYTKQKIEQITEEAIKGKKTTTLLSTDASIETSTTRTNTEAATTTQKPLTEDTQVETSAPSTPSTATPTTTRIPATPESGWFNGLNGYQYKLTATADTWERTREACQALGGDLAVHGMQRSDLRKYISNGVSISSLTWIGLNDLEEEGTFKWVDGTLSTPDNTVWKLGEPNGDRRENCGTVYPPQHSYLINDASCYQARKGICEKRTIS